MCYDISVYIPPEKLEENLSQLGLFINDFDGFQLHYHLSAHRTPNPHIPVVTADNRASIQSFFWGLLPPWMKELDDKWRRNMANAKAETLLEKRSYKSAALKRHCAILMSGFFEWRHIDGKAYPYFIQVKDFDLFAVAGIWEYNRNLNMHSVSLITTAANPMMAKIHNKKERMPAILDKEGIDLWLREPLPSDADEAARLEQFQEQYQALLPIAQDRMEAYTISKLITSRKESSDQAAVLEPEVYYDVQKADGQA
jgi:putative SOS response-associated peptidase YedK